MNVYSDPGKFGLRVVGEIDLEGGYSFAKFVVWANEAGRFLYATDAGCSCPSPFEYAGLPDLTMATRDEVQAAAEAWVAENGEYRHIAGTEVADLMAVVVRGGPVKPFGHDGPVAFDASAAWDGDDLVGTVFLGSEPVFTAREHYGTAAMTVDEFASETMRRFAQRLAGVMAVGS